MTDEVKNKELIFADFMDLFRVKNLFFSVKNWFLCCVSCSLLNGSFLTFRKILRNINLNSFIWKSAIIKGLTRDQLV